MSGDDRPDGRIIVKHPALPPMPQHVKDQVRRMVDEFLFNPPTPPRYRALLERLDREASERKKAERDKKN